MKHLRLIGAAFAVLFYCLPAVAQNVGSVTNHAIPIGKGPGFNGAYTSVTCADQLFLSGRTGLDPACRAIIGADLPFPGASTLGGIKSLAASSNNFLTGLGTDGILTRAQPAFSNLSGSWVCAQAPALTGNVTTSAGSCATTIAALAVTNGMLAGAIAASKLVGSDIATVGTITSGTWNGTTIAGGFGGTGNAFMQFSGPATSIKTYTLPNASDTIVTLTGTQTLTNKTADALALTGTTTSSTGLFSSSTKFQFLNGGTAQDADVGSLVVSNSYSDTPPTNGVFTKGGIKFAGSSSGSTQVSASAAASGTLTLPAATDTLVGKATTDTLTNKTITAATFTGTNSGGTFSGQTFISPTYTGQDSSFSLFPSGDSTKLLQFSATNIPTATTRTLTAPNANGTLVLRDDTATLTNKTISGASNTLSSIGNASLTNSSLTIGSTSVSLGASSGTLSGVTLASPTFSGTVAGAGTIPNSVLANSSTTVNGTTCTLGSTCTVSTSSPNTHLTAFSASGTYTTNASTSTSSIHHYVCVGGGGGGGGIGASGGTSGAGGGGGGALIEGTFTGVAASTGITITIGAGGTAGANTGGTGGSGGGTIIGSPVSITAGGGGGGSGTNVAGLSSAGGGGGGVTGSPSISLSGSNGNTGLATISGGQGAGSPYGSGGAGGPAGTANPGTAGVAYGSGGGGAGNTSQTGGAGAGGLCKFDVVY